MAKPYCPCGGGHGPDDLCMNGVVYGSCSSEVCGGACIDDGTCEGGPDCCEVRRTSG